MPKRAAKTLHAATPGDVGIDVALTDVVHDSAGCLAAYCLAVPAMPLDLDNDPLIMTVGEPCAVVIHCSESQDVVGLQRVGRAGTPYLVGDPKAAVREAKNGEVGSLAVGILGLPSVLPLAFGLCTLLQPPQHDRNRLFRGLRRRGRNWSTDNDRSGCK